MKKDDRILHWKSIYESNRTMVKALLNQIVRLKKKIKKLEKDLKNLERP